MTDHYPYKEVRTNDTIRRLAQEAEAGFSRSEYQQVVYCAGEANPTEPVWFGRAYDRPPFFSFSAVAKNFEVTTTANPCGDITDKAAGMTVGVAEWVRDAQGMYVGAHLWYKVAKAEIDRSGGFGWIDHVYVEGGNTIPLPECIKSSDCLWLWVAGGFFSDPDDLDVVSPNMGTKSIQNLGLTTGEVYQNGKWTRTYNSGNFEPVGNVVTMKNDFDWAVMAAIRGTGCRTSGGGGSTATGTVLFPDQSGPSLVYTFTETSFTDYSPAFFAGFTNYLAGYPDAFGEPFKPTRDVMISIFQDINNFASSNGVTFHNLDRYGQELLEPGPQLTGTPGIATRIYHGEGNNLVAPNEVSHKPFNSVPPFAPLTTSPPHFGAPIHSAIPALKLAKWDHPMVSFDPPAETTYYYIRQRIW